MAFRARTSYLLRRAAEVGGQMLIAKIGQKSRPYAYWPYYARRRSETRRAMDVVRLREFGAINLAAFRKVAAAAAPCRLRRVAERARLALSANVEILGYGALPKPSGAAWHCDDLHNYAWEPKYFPRCDFVAAGKRCD